MKEYVNLIKSILEYGEVRPSRAGDTKSVFGASFKKSNKPGKISGFQSKYVNMDNVMKELNWFLSGDTDVGELIRDGVNIWNQDAYRYYLEISGYLETLLQPVQPNGGVQLLANGEVFTTLTSIEVTSDGKRWGDVTNLPLRLTYEAFVETLRAGDTTFFNMGLIYGHNWTGYVNPSTGYSQLVDTLQTLGDDPFSRRTLTTTWNYQDTMSRGEVIPSSVALPPCHTHFQVYMSQVPGEDNSYVLHGLMNMRSVDVFLGLPYNILSYQFLLSMMAQYLKKYMSAKSPGKIIKVVSGDIKFSLGDAHIYQSHERQANQLKHDWCGQQPIYFEDIEVNADVDIESKQYPFGKGSTVTYKINELATKPPNIRAPLSVGLDESVPVKDIYRKDVLSIALLGKARTGKDTIKDMIEYINDKTKSLTGIKYTSRLSVADGMRTWMDNYVETPFNPKNRREVYQGFYSLIKDMEDDTIHFRNALLGYAGIPPNFTESQIRVNTFMGYPFISTVVTDLRGESELNLLKAQGFKVIEISSPDSVRVPRLKEEIAQAKGIEVEDIPDKMFSRIAEHPTEDNNLAERADYAITNGGEDFDQLFGEVVDVMKRLYIETYSEIADSDTKKLELDNILNGLSWGG